MKGILIVVIFAVIGKFCTANYIECKGVKLGKNVPYPGDCTKFLVCIGGGVLKECKPPLHFNAKVQVCDWPERAGCDPSSGGEKDKGKDSGEEKKEGGDGSGKKDEDEHSGGKLFPECKRATLGKNVPYTGDCTKFLTCIGGGVVKECKAPLHFNAKAQVCDWPERAGCDPSSGGEKDKGKDSGEEKKEGGDGSVKKDEDEHSGGKLFPECKGATLGKNVPYTGDCTKFLTCIGGGVVKECKAPLHFNAKVQVCDWPERAGCDPSSGGEKDKGKDTGDEKKEGGDGSGKKDEDEHSSGKLFPECKGATLGKNVPYTGDCTKFLTCIGGGVVKECKAPLHFNAKAQVCDWPERAGCDPSSGGEKDKGKDSGEEKKEGGDGSVKKDEDEHSGGKLFPECKGATLGKNVPYTGDCTKFLTCIGGGVVKECKAPLHFNAKAQVCDWPERAGCDPSSGGEKDKGKDSGEEKKEGGDGSVKKDEDEHSGGKLFPECKGATLGKNVPYTGDCTKFLTCIGGGVVKECKPPLHFNAKAQVCDWPERAGCE